MSLALQHPYLREFHDPKTEHVTKTRAKTADDVEDFDTPQLKEAVLENVKYFAKQHGYEPVTKEPKQPPPLSAVAPSNIMPSISPMNLIQQQRMMNMNVTPQMAMINGTPMILTPVTMVQPMSQPLMSGNGGSMFNQRLSGGFNNAMSMGNDNIPWTINSNGKPAKRQNSNSAEKTEMDMDQ